MSRLREDSDMHPTDGLRLLLELVQEESDKAVYRAVVFTPSSLFETEATLQAGGEFTIGELEHPGREQLIRLCKLTARGAKKRVADGLPPWPKRIARWKPSS